MFEPHLTNQYHHNDHDGDTSILDELDKLAPLKSFDAFPKVEATYTSQSRRGGVLTAVVGLIIFLLVVVSCKCDGTDERMTWESICMVRRITSFGWITSWKRIYSSMWI